MSDEYALNSMNRHYLDKVMNLAEEADISATEDIFDARGMKLVAKGARISRVLQERLIARRLSKPFESSIAVDGSVDADIVATEAQHIVETLVPVKRMLSSLGAAQNPVRVLADIRLGSAMSTMLTVIQRGGPNALQHSVMVSLIAVCLAQKRGLTKNDQTVVALAGLLHDIGELYIDPEYLQSKRRLQPHEWRHVVVHPRIGQVLIQGLEDFPPAVSQAVFEHHERMDGGGYPRQIGASVLSTAGQIVSVAEMISGVFLKQDHPLERAELALKIIPGEHARELVSAVSDAMQRTRADDTEAGGGTPQKDEAGKVLALYQRIDAVLAGTQALLDHRAMRSAKGVHLLNEVVRRATVIQRAFSSTGLDACMTETASFIGAQDGDLLFETAVAMSEIEWRLRDVARDLALQAIALDPDEFEAVQPMVNLLDGDTRLPDAVALDQECPIAEA